MFLSLPYTAGTTYLLIKLSILGLELLIYLWAMHTLRTGYFADSSRDRNIAGEH